MSIHDKKGVGLQHMLWDKSFSDSTQFVIFAYGAKALLFQCYIAYFPLSLKWHQQWPFPGSPQNICHRLLCFSSAYLQFGAKNRMVKKVFFQQQNILLILTKSIYKMNKTGCQNINHRAYTYLVRNSLEPSIKVCMILQML